MKRRAVLASLMALPTAARAQAKVPRVAYLGVLSAASIDPQQIEGLKKGLAENGLIDGRTVKVEYYWADGKPERLTELSQRLAGDAGIDVIVTVGSQAPKALQAAGARQPIVLAIVGDPITARVANSLGRPSGTMTGLSMLNPELEAKRLEILKELVPQLSSVLLIYDPSMPANELDLARDAARVLGLETVMGKVGDPAGFDAVFADAVRKGAAAVSVTASPFLNFNRKPLIELAAHYRLPSIWENLNYVREGGLASYGPSFPDLYRRSATFVARILKGAMPGDLPFEQPTVFELGVNRRVADRLGVKIPASILSRADEVVE